MITAFHRIIVACDNAVCRAKDSLIAKGSQWVRGEEATGKNYAQARMQLIRAGWKIRKNKVVCPDCIRAGVKMRDLIPRKKHEKEIAGR